MPAFFVFSLFSFKFHPFSMDLFLLASLLERRLDIVFKGSVTWLVCFLWGGGGCLVGGGKDLIVTS